MRLIICLTLLAALSTAVWADRFDGREKAFVAGLRSRQLYDVAQLYCLRTLNRDDLTVTDQAAVTVELMQNRAAAAQIAGADQREAAWQSVWQTQEAFEATFPRHSKTLLVTIQTALSRLSYATSIQQELSAEMVRPADIENSRSAMIDQLRQARRAFENVERQIERMIPEQRSKSPNEDEFAVDQLAIMRSNVRFQVARCHLQTAYGYDADDTVNRASIIGDVLRLLNEVQNGVSSQQRIWWLTKIVQAECQRLVGRTDDAWQTLNGLPQENRPVDLTSDILEQRLLVAAARVDVAWAEKHMRQSVKQRLSNQSPQMEIAQMRVAVMLSANAVSDADRQGWLDRSAEIVRNMNALHGAYWSRRAGLALIEATGVKADVPASGSVGSARSLGSSAGQREIMIQTAQQAARSGNDEDAIKAWIRAIELTPEPADRQPLLINVSKNFERLKRHDQAARYLLTGARENPQAASAAAMHLRGCWNLAQTVGKENNDNNENTSRELITALEQHLQTWPQNETRVQAVVWLTAEYNKQKTFLRTVKLLTTGPISSQSVGQLRNTFYLAQKHLAENDPSENDPVDQERLTALAAQTVDYLQQQSSQIQDVASAGAATAEKVIATAVEIGLVSKCRSVHDADAMIRQHGVRFQIAPQSEIQLYRSWLTAQLTQDVDGAVAILQQLAPPEPQCRKILAIAKRHQGLGSQSDLISDQYQLAVVEQALKTSLGERDKMAWTFERAKLFRATGDAESALALLKPMADQAKKDIAIQLEYARALSESPGRDEEGLQTWRRLAQRLAPGTEPWYEAKFNVGQALVKAGQGDAAKKLLNYVGAVRGWGGSAWAESVRQLLEKL